MVLGSGELWDAEVPKVRKQKAGYLGEEDRSDTVCSCCRMLTSLMRASNPTASTWDVLRPSITLTLQLLLIYLQFLVAARHVHPEKNKQGIQKMMISSWKTYPLQPTVAASESGKHLDETRAAVEPDFEWPSGARWRPAHRPSWAALGQVRWDGGRHGICLRWLGEPNWEVLFEVSLTLVQGLQIWGVGMEGGIRGAISF